MSRLLRALLLGFALGFQAAQVQAEAPAILLAQVYRNQVDVSKYLISEKLDGVRAIWDGQTLRFRGGREVNAPGWFVGSLPKRPLDGELWMGRGTFERLSGIVRRDVPDDAAWRQVRYMIFELPGASGPFARRADLICDLARQANLPWLQAIEQFRVADRKELQKRLGDVVAGGGEGLMLHRDDAPYETGRSDSLLKMKQQEDAEAVVIAHLPGKGKYSGMLGALRVRSESGQEFSLGSGFTEQQRRDPLPIGTIVTYRYRGFTANGLPRFASFLRVREN